MEGDATRLAQVVGNVLNNANKFSDPGSQVFIDLRPESGKGSAILTIRDTGIGMEPDILARVFEPFSQADRSLDRSRGGLGLGMALVKGLVELHGGEVRATSAGLGKGTEVKIELPLQKPSAPVEDASPCANGHGHRRSILVIEDNVDTAESMRMLLQLTGHEVNVALAGESGVEAAHRFRPEVIFCDIGLPGRMDGYAVARALCQAPELSSVYLVALTGYGQTEDQRRCLDAGFDAHLVKPVDYAEIQRHLQQHRPAKT